MNCRSLLKLLLITVAVIPTTTIKADSVSGPALVINEIMPANVDMYIDPAFYYGSWIELYNPDTVDINIKGWYISNDSTNLKKCSLGKFRPRKIRAKGYLVLWFGHNDENTNQVDLNLENNYDDPYEYSQIILSDQDGNIRAMELYPYVPPRMSWARVNDGQDEWSFTGYPTPSKTNSTSIFADEQLIAPEVSLESQLFSDQLSFNVDIPQGATLYYTTDGSLPAPGKSKTYVSTGEHTISKTTVFRFRLFHDQYLPSPVVTRSFIKTDNQYGIPVLSVVTDNDNLYSSSYGIWVKGVNGKAGNGQSDPCNWNMDWDRPANVEIIDVSNKMVINQEVDICNSGRYSRAYDPHSFKMEAKKKFGYENNFFAYTVFQDKPYNKYKTLKVRNGGNSYRARFRDAAVQEIILRSGLDLDCQSYQPVHHYINGVYKGVINIREPNNKDYAYSNFGIDEEDVDFFKVDHNNGNSGHGYGYTQVKGSSDAWDEWLALSKNASNQDTYDKICKIVDIEEFANYMAIEFLLFNQDWPRNNVKAYRRTKDGRFRFIIFDMDNMLGDGQPSGDPFTTFDSEEYRTVIVTLFHNMLKNQSFSKLFIDSYCIIAGSVFRIDRCKEIINELGERAKREMAFKNESPESDITLLTNNLTQSYITKKISQLQSWSYIQDAVVSPTNTISVNSPGAGLIINGIKVPQNYFSGQMLSDITISCTVPQGYRFVGWKDGTGKVVSRKLEYSLDMSKSNTLTASFSKKQSLKPVRINEISAANDIFINDSFKKHDWIELFNASKQPYDASGMYLTNDLSKPDKYIIPNGTVIPSNGYLVIWCDKNNGDLLHSTFKLDNDKPGCLILTSADESWADTLAYSPHSKFQSVGLYPDGGISTYIFNHPSIGRNNYLALSDTLNENTIPDIVDPIKAQLKNDLIYNLYGLPATDIIPGQVYMIDGKKVVFLP